MSSETKARSRISSERVQELFQAGSKYSSAHTKKNSGVQASNLLSFHQVFSRKKSFRASSLSSAFSFAPNDLAKKYLLFLPSLLISLLLFLALLYIFTTTYPQELANWGLFQSYPLVLLLFFLACFFLMTFIFLDKRRGIMFSSILSLLLFLKFQDVFLSLPILVTAALTIAGFEVVLGVRNRR